MDYLVFLTQQTADIAVETIYQNMVKSIDSPQLLNVETQEVVPKDSLTSEELVQVNAADRYYPVFGVNLASGVKNSTQGYTTAWAIPRETVSATWVFPKPEDALLTGVVGYTISPYDPAWFSENALPSSI